MQKHSLQIVLSSLLLFQSNSQADVIQIQNQSPLIAIFGMPAPVDFVESEKSLSVDLIIANNFVPRASANEKLQLDGETSRLVTHYRQRLSNCWMFGVELPLIHHSGGTLDSFVDRWHGWFGLPESGRPNVVGDRLNYQYTVNGQLVVHHDEVGSGVGDISLILTQRQKCSQAAGRLIRGGVKLPTGDPDRLFGSGASDAFVDISKHLPNFYRTLDISYTTGLLLLGKSRVNLEHNRHVVYGSLSLELPLTSRLSLDTQIAVQSPHIKSNLRVLSDWPVQLLIGTSYQVSKSIVWNIALSEDPEYGTSSDVVFQMGMRTSY